MIELKKLVALEKNFRGFASDAERKAAAIRHEIQQKEEQLISYNAIASTYREAADMTRQDIEALTKAGG